MEKRPNSTSTWNDLHLTDLPYSSGCLKMCPFTNVVASFKKHINLSSNKLIRCVLLNAAVELFGCLSSRSCNDFYWDMGYLYTPLPCTDALSWPNTDAPSTRLSKVAEAPTVHRHEDSKLISNELVEAGEVKAPLECVGEEVCAEPQTTPEHVPHWIVAPAIACLDENTELLNDSEVGVYLNFSFSHDDGSTDEMDVTPSVFWDSYDLHTSRSDTSFHLPNKPCNNSCDMCNFDLMLTIQKAPEHNEEKLASSTPWIKKSCSILSVLDAGHEDS